MEADLSQYHRLDLADLYRGRLTYRQVLVRVMNLPAESATWTAVRGGPAWTIAHDIADATRMHIAVGRGVPAKDLKPHWASPAHVAKPQGDDDPYRQRAMERKKQRAERKGGAA